MSVQRTQVEGSVPVTVGVEVTSGVDLLASGGGAWVSDVFVEPGDPVSEGDAVFGVDGVQVIAAATGFPLSETLSVGMVGPQVAELEGLLGRLGYFDGAADEQFTSATGQAVHELAHAVGAGHVMEFDPGWLVHLPDRTVTVAEVLVAPATPAPAAGAVWARLPGQLGEVTVGVPQGWSAGTSPGDGYELTADGVSLQARVTGDGDGLEVAAGQQEQLWVLVATQRAAGGGTSSGGQDGSGGDGSSANQVEVEMTARPSEPVDVVVVPVSAVATGNDGEPCVATVALESDGVAEMVWSLVSVVGSQPGVGTYLDPSGVPDGRFVVLDPEVPDGLTCG